MVAGKRWLSVSVGALYVMKKKQTKIAGQGLAGTGLENRVVRSYLIDKGIQRKMRAVLMVNWHLSQSWHLSQRVMVTSF